MKIVTANNKTILKLSKAEWQKIGDDAGWTKEAGFKDWVAVAFILMGSFGFNAAQAAQATGTNANDLAVKTPEIEQKVNDPTIQTQARTIAEKLREKDKISLKTKMHSFMATIREFQTMEFDEGGLSEQDWEYAVDTMFETVEKQEVARLVLVLARSKQNEPDKNKILNAYQQIIKDAKLFRDMAKAGKQKSSQEFQTLLARMAQNGQIIITGINF